MRVDLVDPPAYSPPYDHALAAGLARHGAAVRLVTSAFAYGDAPAPDGYTRDELFYGHAFGAPGSRLRALSKRAEHPLDMLRYRPAAVRGADVVHFQWLTVPRLDLRLLPRRPTVLTIHDPLGRAREPLPAAAFKCVDAIVVHSSYAREQVIAQHGLEPERVHVIRHGVLGAGEAFATARVRTLPAELNDTGEPVVLSYGLIRPYKGIEALLEAWRGIEHAQLWIVGRPMMDVSRPLAAAGWAGPNLRLVPRYVTAAEQAALFHRADIVVLPYERGQRFGFSGVLATALGHGKAIVLSDIGGFTEVGALGAARLIPPGDPQALRETLVELIADPDQRARLAAAAAKAAAEQYSWDAAAAATLALYETIAAP
ncbi:MAG TPA: glycosyltransferase family 4 protein [Solirubrobacteraceae bacterium]|nr:glycosyltransferase family 4 protein [Solirubrobacteraceae bacterium]